MDCGNASGGGGAVSLPRHASNWYASTSNCREILPGQQPLWVYKYSSFDPPAVKDRARQAARSMLQYSFCSAPSSNNPKVQAIVEEILAGTPSSRERR